MYREQLLDHYHRPRGWGLKSHSSEQQYLLNPNCGDAVTVQVDVADNHITAMRFEGHGCVISRASASLLCEYVAAKNINECLSFGLSDVEALLGTAVQPLRVKCALLPLDALHQALHRLS